MSSLLLLLGCDMCVVTCSGNSGAYSVSLRLRVEDEVLCAAGTVRY